MKTFTILSAIFLAPRLVSSASLTSFCLTYYNSTPTTPVPTSTYAATTTSTRTVKSTSTPVTTVTPSSATTTKTVTSVVKTTSTVSKVTGTYTSTTTFTSSSVVTTVSTSTVTSTATSTVTDTSPATATPSPDFVPLQAELTPGGYSNFACPSPSQFVAKRGDRDLFARDPNAEAELLLRAIVSSTSVPASYPASVGCTTLYYATATSTSVITASTTVTKTAKQGTITSTTTSTTTSTVTKVPSTVQLTVVSTTTTATSTATSISTVTTMSTSTTTAYQPSSTVYPACQSNNLVQCVNGYQVSNPNFVYNIFEISGPTDAASCCIACNMNQGCGGSFYYIDQKACYGVIDDVCEGNNSFASFQVQPGNYVPAVYSNSNCGRWRVRAPDS